MVVRVGLKTHDAGLRGRKKDNILKERPSSSLFYSGGLNGKSRRYLATSMNLTQVQDILPTLIDFCSLNHSYPNRASRPSTER